MCDTFVFWVIFIVGWKVSNVQLTISAKIPTKLENCKKVVFFDEVRFCEISIFFTFVWQSNEKKVYIWVFFGVSQIKNTSRGDYF